jgi:hypothetical protein
MNSIITLAVSLAFAVPAFADVNKAQTLAPSDFGAHKWIVGATGGEGEVVILRCIRTHVDGDKKWVDINDSVSYNPGKRHEGSFVAINPDYFNVEKKGEPNWNIATFTGNGWCPGRWTGSETGENSGRISFTDSKGCVTRYEFSAITLAYEDAAKLYNDFPAKSSSGGWEFAGSPTNGGQTGAGQPATASESKSEREDKPQLKATPVDR